MGRYKAIPFKDTQGKDIVYFQVGKPGGVNKPGTYLYVRDELAKARDAGRINDNLYRQHLDALKDLRANITAANPRYAKNEQTLAQMYPDMRQNSETEEKIIRGLALETLLLKEMELEEESQDLSLALRYLSTQAAQLKNATNYKHAA